MKDTEFYNNSFTLLLFHINVLIVCYLVYYDGRHSFQSSPMLKYAIHDSFASGLLQDVLVN